MSEHEESVLGDDDPTREALSGELEREVRVIVEAAIHASGVTQRDSIASRLDDFCQSLYAALAAERQRTESACPRSHHR